MSLGMSEPSQGEKKKVARIKGLTHPERLFSRLIIK